MEEISPHGSSLCERWAAAPERISIRSRRSCPAGQGAADSPLVALVADVATGTALLGRLSPADLAAAKGSYGFLPGADLKSVFQAGLSTPSAPGDREATAAYAAAGARLTLLPALPVSVIRGGGYWCASNHVWR